MKARVPLAGYDELANTRSADQNAAARAAVLGARTIRADPGDIPGPVPEARPRRRCLRSRSQDLGRRHAFGRRAGLDGGKRLRRDHP